MLNARPRTLSPAPAPAGDPTTSRFCLDALHVHDSLEETWKQTVEAFATIRRLTAGDSAILQRIVMEAVEGYAAAGCVYYEMRTGLKPLPDKKSFLELLGSAIKRAEGKHGITVKSRIESPKHDNTPCHDAHTPLPSPLDGSSQYATPPQVRLLVSVDRGASVQDSMETIDAAIAAFESQNKALSPPPPCPTCCLPPLCPSTPPTLCLIVLYEIS